MRPTLRLIALATGAAQPTSIHAGRKVRATAASVPGAPAACTRAGKLRMELTPRLEEDVRLIGALAEFFAAAAAKRLMDTDGAMDATRPTLPFIALATGAALCAPLLEWRTIPRSGKGNNSRRRARRLSRSLRASLSISRPSAS